MKFKIGDKVRITGVVQVPQGTFGEAFLLPTIFEINSGIGIEGIIVAYFDARLATGFDSYKVESKSFTHRSSYWFFPDCLTAITEPLVPVYNVSTCPRCGKEMVEKVTADYGIINKCSKCGYC
jgi:hypothetical protein